MTRPLVSGILPAVATPFDSNGLFVSDILERLCGIFYEKGAHGIYVCGQTGEGLQQSVAQRKAVAECAVRSTPSGKTVMIHVGAASPDDAAELARHAESIGAHSVSALPPENASSMDEVYAYYSAIAKATSLPLFLYFFPAFSPKPATVDDLRRLCALPGVAGLKFTSTDLFTLWKLKQDGLTVLNGYDEILAAGLIMGADGGIGTFYNIVPEWFVRIFSCASEGTWDMARGWQQRVNELIQIGLRFPVHAAAKEMLAWQGIPCGAVLPPRRNLSAEEKYELHSALETLELPRR